MQGPSIEFADVSLTLGNTQILRNVSFSVHSGTVHCIIGANGGGKTSLIRSLLGQMPHSGRISLEWHGSRIIGYVPQTLDFDKTLPVTVRDFLAMTTQRRPVFLGVSKARRALIDAALDRVGLAQKSAYKLGSLSGGERQRVLFAQATLPEPALLVLDEPMTGLDLEGHAIIERAIRTFAQGGGTVLWINHDILKVHEVADRLTYIDQTVMLDGPPREALATEPAARLYPSLVRLEAAEVS
ncbi:MAG: metal ABC transporter ATP-binding protein [Gammaproteobacteria bacterium]|jgi:zinc transport system ATP-binding protein